MGMVCGGVPENWLTKSLAWVGFYSYSIYLWHNLVIFTAAPLLRHRRRRQSTIAVDFPTMIAALHAMFAPVDSCQLLLRADVLVADR